MISIIALLVAILLPTLTGARDTAKMIQCASQQHQLGIAFGLYAASENDYFPPTGNVNNMTWNNPATSDAWFQHFLVQRYFAQDAFYCPEQAKSIFDVYDHTHSDPDDENIWFLKFGVISYGYNHSHLGSSHRYDASFSSLAATPAGPTSPGYQGPPANHSDLTGPSKTLVCLDNAIWDFRSEGYFWVPDVPSTARLAARPYGLHPGDATNVLYADSHVFAFHGDQEDSIPDPGGSLTTNGLYAQPELGFGWLVATMELNFDSAWVRDPN